MGAPIFMDMVDGLIEAIDDLNRRREIAILKMEIFGGLKTERVDGVRAAIEPDARVFKRVEDGERAPIADKRPVKEERLHRVARGGIVELRVKDDGARLLELGLLVDIDMADAVGVPKDGDPRRAHDAADERVRAAGDHEIDHIVEREELAHLFTALDEAKKIARDLGLDRRF